MRSGKKVLDDVQPLLPFIQRFLEPGGSITSFLVGLTELEETERKRFQELYGIRPQSKPAKRPPQSATPSHQMRLRLDS